MDDEGIRTRSTFGREDPRDRDGVEGVGPESVDGLGREDDQAAGENGLGGAADIGYH